MRPPLINLITAFILLKFNSQYYEGKMDMDFGISNHYTVTYKMSTIGTLSKELPEQRYS
jgi:hypothetical protein